jgi:hypothetical protein
MKSELHPPYSPNLKPSDFCLFGSIKECLTDLSFDGAGGLLEAVQTALEGMEN